MLLATGIPGSGKTIFASIVIDYLQKEWTNTSSVGYIYFAYKESASQTVTNLLAALVRTSVESSGTMLSELEARYRETIRHGTRPTTDDILVLLKATMRKRDCNFIVVDALDEGDEHEVEKLVSILRELLDTAASYNIKIMLTSRPSLRANHHFPRCHCLEVRANDADIETYIQGRMSRRAPDVRFNENLGVHIIAGICSIADGMCVHTSLYSKNRNTNGDQSGFCLLNFTWTRRSGRGPLEQSSKLWISFETLTRPERMSTTMLIEKRCNEYKARIMSILR